jgi:hypothetical protein
MKYSDIKYQVQSVSPTSYFCVTTNKNRTLQNMQERCCFLKKICDTQISNTQIVLRYVVRRCCIWNTINYEKLAYYYVLTAAAY